MEKLGKKVLLFDGGFGTELQKYNVKWQYLPEELNITNPQIIQEIHSKYVFHGVDFLTTNTFGCNQLKVNNSPYSLAEIITAAIHNANLVKQESKVFFDIGPTGQLLFPLGTLSFDETYNIYKEIVELSQDKVDGYIVETFTSLYELKACLLAIKENTNKPVFVTMSFTENGRTLTGASPNSMVLLLEGLGVDALGVNCSLGPVESLEIISEMASLTNLPIIFQPNRGLPKLCGQKTIYQMTDLDFFQSLEKHLKLGVAIIGGCCGTTPDTIALLKKYQNRNVVQRKIYRGTYLSSEIKVQEINGIVICGERINPTGKKKIKEALLKEDYHYLVQEAISQEQNGADILDVNVGIPNIDEKKAMSKLIPILQEVVDLPLVIDSSNIEALEIALRYYNGIPLINSINGKKEIMEAVFPLAKKYGAVVIALPLDEKGIPETALGRLEIVKKIVATGAKYQICHEKIIIDPLVLTVASNPEMAKVTLETQKLIKENMQMKTIMGISNVSFGLPNRSLLNKTFLTMALNNGLNIPIINPCDPEMIETIKAFRALNCLDEGFISFLSIDKKNDEIKTTISFNNKNKENSEQNCLFKELSKGSKLLIAELTTKALEQQKPLEIIEEIIIPCLNEIGKLYEEGKVYLPTLMKVADNAKTAFSIIEKRINKKTAVKEVVMLAVVEGDIHDIGKNIIKTILESYGYQVIDLGKDVLTEEIVSKYLQLKPDVIGLSALMTTTVSSMKKAIIELRKNNCQAPIFVGGAVLSSQLAEELKADYYAKNALEFVFLLEKIFHCSDQNK